MVTAGHSIDNVQGTSAGHRLPAMAFRWPALAHRSVRGTTLASGYPSLAFAGNRWPATRQRWEVFVEMIRIHVDTRHTVQYLLTAA